MAGERSYFDGVIGNTGVYGLYWSSTVLNDNSGNKKSKHILFGSGSAGVNWTIRTFGQSVRCINN